MKRWSALLVVPLCLGPALAAQETAVRPVSPIVKYGKWGVLAASLGMNYLASRAHDRADKAFDELRARCLPEPFLCQTSPSGAYLDPTSEALYQESVREDRKARNWLFGGEAALLGAAAMFVWELTRPKGPPENIPFEPELTVTPHATRLGMRLAF